MSLSTFGGCKVTRGDCLFELAEKIPGKPSGLGFPTSYIKKFSGHDLIFNAFHLLSSTMAVLYYITVFQYGGVGRKKRQMSFFEQNYRYPWLVVDLGVTAAVHSVSITQPAVYGTCYLLLE